LEVIRRAILIDNAAKGLHPRLLVLRHSGA
jgi:hypothetical protein